MTAPAEVRHSPAKRIRAWRDTVPPVGAVVFRWVFIVAVTYLAFHKSLHNLFTAAANSLMSGYAWLVPLAGLVAAQGVARRRRSGPPIHDRQTDVIVGVMGLVLALLLHGVLLPRYALYFHLLRLDLLALWVFVISACIVLFGLRPVMRFAWVWVVMLAVFPLPYRLVVAFLGGSHLAAGAGTLIIAALASAVSVGRYRTRALRGAIVAWLVGALLLAYLWVWFPDAPLFVYQFVPAATAMVLSGALEFVIARRNHPMPLIDRAIQPLAARQAWSAMPLVLAAAIVLSLVPLPNLGLAPVSRVESWRPSTTLAIPAGWHRGGAAEQYLWAQRYYGPGATFVRQEMVSDVGDPRFDKYGRPREVMVDTTTTSNHPLTFETFPARVLYRVPGIRLSDARWVDLGYGVTADLFNGVDDDLLVTWNGLQWTWTNGHVAQRILVISVDNHDDDAPFPEPVRRMGTTLNSMFTVFFRGNAVAVDKDANVKDAELLTEFGRALVRAQLEPLGMTP